MSVPDDESLVLALPGDLFAHIFEFLALVDGVNLLLTCRAIYDLHVSHPGVSNWMTALETQLYFLLQEWRWSRPENRKEDKLFVTVTLRSRARSLFYATASVRIQSLREEVDDIDESIRLTSDTKFRMDALLSSEGVVFSPNAARYVKHEEEYRDICDTTERDLDPSIGKIRLRGVVKRNGVPDGVLICWNESCCPEESTYGALARTIPAGGKGMLKCESSTSGFASDVLQVKKAKVLYSFHARVGKQLRVFARRASDRDIFTPMALKSSSSLSSSSSFSCADESVFEEDLGCLWGIHHHHQIVGLGPVEMNLLACLPKDALRGMMPPTTDSVVVKTDSLNRIGGDTLCFCPRNRNRTDDSVGLVLLPCCDVSAIRTGTVPGLGPSWTVNIHPGFASEDGSFLACPHVDPDRSKGQLFLLRVTVDESSEMGNVCKAVWTKPRPAYALESVLALASGHHIAGADSLNVFIWDVEKKAATTTGGILKRKEGIQNGRLMHAPWMGEFGFLVHTREPSQNVLLFDLRQGDDDGVAQTRSLGSETEENAIGSAQLFDQTLVILSRGDPACASAWDLRQTSTPIVEPFACFPNVHRICLPFYRVRVPDDGDVKSWRFFSGAVRDVYAGWSLNGKVHVAMNRDKQNFKVFRQRFV